MLVTSPFIIDASKKNRIHFDLYALFMLFMLFILCARFVFFFNFSIHCLVLIFSCWQKILRLTTVWKHSDVGIASAFQSIYYVNGNSTRRVIHTMCTHASLFSFRSLYSSVDSFTTFRQYRLSSGPARKTRCRIAGEIAGVSRPHTRRTSSRFGEIPAMKVDDKR